MATHGPITTQPKCPRCGYDQSGAVAAWTDRCPVAGTCPECGTGFRWADLFDPARQDIGWLVEHAGGFWAACRRTPGMLVRMARPRVFWREVGVRARVRPKFLALWCAAIAALLYVLTGAMLYPGEYLWVRSWATPSRGVSNAEIHAHALREAALDSLLRTRMISWGGRTFWSTIRDTWVVGISIPVWSVAIIGNSAIWVLMLAAVPVTRRAAKLRPAHIARAALLAILAAVLIFALSRTASAMHIYWRGSGGALTPVYWGSGVASGVLFAWSVSWWRAAAKDGWGLHRQGALVGLATLGGLLGAAVAVLLFRFQAVVRMLAEWT